MTMKQYEGSTFGKWILAGEHAVLRGSPALAFPLLSKSLKLSYNPSRQPLQVQFGGTHGQELQLLFWGVLERALETLSLHLGAMTGEMHVQSDLPAGAGLGASAALCAGVGRWCLHQGFIEPVGVYEFSRRLENMFHGESSGVDIAVSLKGHGIRFVRGQEMTALSPAWTPRLYLSYSGQRGVTSECVSKVKAMLMRDPALGERIDQKMKAAVHAAERALQLDEESGFSVLESAIGQACDCFAEWDLITSGLQSHLSVLKEAGARVTKPTGSGGGGYALSLWKDEPPLALQAGLIPLQFNSPDVQKLHNTN